MFNHNKTKKKMTKKKFYESPWVHVFEVHLEQRLCGASYDAESIDDEEHAREDDLEDGYLWE